MRYKQFTYFVLVFTGLLIFSCKRHHDFELDNKGSCFDGKLNQNETDVDCGGVCAACATCTDGIVNGQETGIDCGGTSCDSCGPPNVPHNCSGLVNTTVFNMGSTYTVAIVSSAFIPGPDPGQGYITLQLALNSYIEHYEVQLGQADFANMPIGSQRVYTTVDSSAIDNMQPGETLIRVYESGMSAPVHVIVAGFKVYIKKISSNLTQVWFCGVRTEFNPTAYYFTVGAKF